MLNESRHFQQRCKSIFAWTSISKHIWLRMWPEHPYDRHAVGMLYEPDIFVGKILIKLPVKLLVKRFVILIKHCIRSIIASINTCGHINFVLSTLTNQCTVSFSRAQTIMTVFVIVYWTLCTSRASHIVNMAIPVPLLSTYVWWLLVQMLIALVSKKTGA